MANFDINDLSNSNAEYRTKTRGLHSNFGAWQYLGGPYLSFQRRFINTSVSTPGFDKLNRYQLPQQPHTRIEWATLYTPFSAQYLWTWPDGTWAANDYRGNPRALGVNVDLTANYGPADGPLESKALDRLFDNLSQTKGSAAVSMAEIHKTAKMVGDTAVRLATAYSALRHGRMSDFSDALGISVSKRRLAAYRGRYKQQFGSTGDSQQFAASTWLEFTYGWKPLIGDVYTQAENLSRYLTERQGAIREARGSATETVTTIEPRFSANADWVVSKYVRVKTRCGYVVRYKLADGQSSIINVFGLNNPAIIAWELLPFSFVADWFLPIGNFLSQLTATAGLQFHSGVKTRKSTSFAVSEMRGTGVPRADQGGTLRFVVSGGSAKNNIRTGKSRSVLTAFPYVRFPEFKNPLSVSHATSSIALIQAVFHGGARNSSLNKGKGILF